MVAYIMDFSNSVKFLCPFIAFLLSVLQKGFALECYACIDQEDNFDKCVKTVIVCPSYEEYCVSQVSWRIMKDWKPRILRHHYITKGCASKETCDTLRNVNNTETCTRNWYEDWKCHECCRGILCNYFVTLDATSKKSSSILISALGGIAIWFASR